MGQKVNPVGLRLGINRTWDSRWYAEGAMNMAACCYMRTCASASTSRSQLRQAGVAKIVIERPHKKCRVTIYLGSPGCGHR